MGDLLEIVSFDQGIEVIGGREMIEDGAMRIGAGQNNIHTGTWRSRWGAQSLYPAVNPIYVWYASNHRYAIDGTGKVWRDGVQLTVPAGVSLVNGQRPIVDIAPPHFTSTAAYSFVPGAGTPFKIDASGVITNWGIAPPGDTMTAAATDVVSQLIDAMDATTGWTNVGGTLTLDTADFAQGTGSLQLVTGAAKQLFTLTKSITVDLSGSQSNPVIDFDLIDFDFKVDQPQNCRDVMVEFDLGTNFTTDYYSFSMPVINLISANNYVRSTADLSQVDALVQQFLFNPQFVPTPSIQSSLMSDFYAGLQEFYKNAPHTYKTAPKLKPNAKSLQSYALALAGAITSGSDQWWRVRLPKAAFSRRGTNASLTWANVTKVRFKVQNLTGTTTTFHFDNLFMSGGTGLYGNYGYLVSFANTVTGSYSNPNPTTLVVNGVFRGQVTLSNIPISSDPQVNARYIWRTVGNGGLLYLCIVIPDNTTTSIIDQVSDFIGLNTGDFINSLSAISVVNSWTSKLSTPSTSITVRTNTGPQAQVNDLYVAFVETAFAAATLAPPAGWTVLVAQWTPTDTTTTAAIWYKVVTAPDIGNSFIFTAGAASVEWCATIVSFRGVNTSTPIVSAGTGATGTGMTATAPSVASATQLAMGVVYVSSQTLSNQTFQNPSGLVNIFNIPCAFGGNTPGGLAAYQNGLTTTPFGPISASLGISSQWQAVSFVLKPGTGAVTANGSLSLEALTYGNILPSPNISACAYLLGTMFTTGDTTPGQMGRIYYSAVGYAEGIAGYTVVTDDDDPMLALATFNNNIYGFSRSGIWLGVDQTQSPVAPVWQFVQILKVPGTTDPQSVVETDIGIVYRATDGLRFFNGYQSNIIVSQILPLFRSESAEAYTSFGTIIAATLGRSEYVFTDGNKTFAVSSRAVAQTIQVQGFNVRDLGIATTALWYEEETGHLAAGILSGWHLLEEPVLTKDIGTTAIAINLLPKCFYSGEKFKYKVQRIYVDANVNIDNLTVSLITDTGAIAHPIALTGTGTRTLSEFPFGQQTTRLVGVQITGNANNAVEIFKIAIEVEKVTAT